MGSRMIRDGLLDSDRYWSVSTDARQMFVHLLLLADDFGCVSLSATFIRRRCFNDAPSHERIAKLINELSDADLVRPYDVDRGCYGFIPRFKQRLQRNTLKHPKPPEWLIEGDLHAVEMFNKINKETTKPTVDQPLPTVDQPISTVGQPPEVKRSEEKNNVGHRASVDALSATGFEDFWRLYPKKVAKQTAKKAWGKVKVVTDTTEAEIFAGLIRALNCEQWQRDNGQYIPHAATWLNNRRWEDEVGPVGGLPRFVPA